MNDKHFKWLLYLIVFVILATIAIQIFWNYKNYQTNKQHVFNDIQVSLDDAVEAYYADLSKNNFFTIISSDDTHPKTFKHKKAWDSIIKPITSTFNRDSINVKFSSLTLKDSTFTRDSIDVHLVSSVIDSVEKTYLNSYDSIRKRGLSGFTQLSKDKTSGITFNRNTAAFKHNQVIWGKQASDSIKLLKGLSTIFIAMQQDSLDYKKLDSIVILKLHKKGVYSDFYEYML